MLSPHWRCIPLRGIMTKHHCRILAVMTHSAASRDFLNVPHCVCLHPSPTGVLSVIAALLGAELSASAPHLRLRHVALVAQDVDTPQLVVHASRVSLRGLAAFAQAALSASPSLVIHIVSSYLRSTRTAPRVVTRADGVWLVATPSCERIAGAAGSEDEEPVRLEGGIAARLRLFDDDDGRALIDKLARA